MRKIFALVAVALVSMGTTARVASAEEVKIGTVDLQKALQTVESGKKARATLEKEFNEKKKSIDAEEAALKKMGEEFKKQSLVLSDEARAKKQGELQERYMKYQQTRAGAQQEIGQKEQELTAPLITKLRASIAEMAKSKGYTIVLERNENMVLYSLDKDDMTTELITAFNKANK